MTCNTCGRSLNPDMQFCPGCGRPVAAGPAVVTQVSMAPEARQVGSMAQPAMAQQPAVCIKCGAELQESLAFCTACGTPRPAKATVGPVAGEAAYTQPVMSFCVKCGSTFDASSAFCTKCGAPRQSGAVTGSNTEAWAKNALLLETIAGYFGFLGLGHIYAGRALLGIGLMLGWWLGLTIIVGMAATGIGLLIALPAFFGIPYFSGTRARDYIRANRTS
jgi:predicted amidophosphoribosyltransferase